MWSKRVYTRCKRSDTFFFSFPRKETFNLNDIRGFQISDHPRLITKREEGKQRMNESADVAATLGNIYCVTSYISMRTV